MLLVLASSVYQIYRAGQLPFTQDFAPFNMTAHQQRLASVVAHIPPNAKVTAQSDLYPHIPARADLYLFPTISDADYILLDVTGQTYPIQPGEYVETVKQLLNETPAGIVVVEDGYLLLARNEGTKFTLPDAFFAFARADTNTIQHPMRVRFGDSLELLGYDFETLPPRQVAAPAANIRTYWRALRLLDERLRFVYRFYTPDGYLRNAQHSSPTERWYPTTRWQVGETMVVEQRGVQGQQGTRIGMRVERGEAAAPVVEPPDVSEGDLIERGVVRLH